MPQARRGGPPHQGVHDDQHLHERTGRDDQGVRHQQRGPEARRGRPVLPGRNPRRRHCRDPTAADEVVGRPAEQVRQIADQEHHEAHVRDDEEEHPEPEGGGQHRAPGLDVVTERVVGDGHHRRGLPFGFDEIARLRHLGAEPVARRGHAVHLPRSAPASLRTRAGITCEGDAVAVGDGLFLEGMTAPARPANPADLLRNRRYLALLVLSAALGVVVSFAAYWFLKVIAEVNAWTFTDLPHGLSLDPVPTWWPIVPLGVAGLAVGFIVRAAPGGGGEVPIEGFKPGGVTPPGHLLGIALAALASIGLGAVVGPEGPLIALGGGLAYLLIWIRNRDVPAQTGLMVAATGSFAAVSTLLGSPILGAILLLEASGLGGVTASVALVPGLLGAGIGSLVFVGLDAWTGFGTFSLTVPNLAAVGRPTVAGIAWAVAVGLAGAALCQVIHLLARRLLALVERRVVLITALVGLATGALAILYNQRTGHSAADVLFSGQAALPGVIQNSASYSVGALLLLILCKGLAYIGGLSTFRGG